MNRSTSYRYGLTFVVVFGVAVVFYYFFLQTDYQAVFEAETGIQLSDGTRTVASCTEWGVDAAVFEIEATAWLSFVTKLQQASPVQEHARRYTGLLCDSVLNSIKSIGKTGSIYDVERHNEGVVWAIDSTQHRLVWEVWY